MTRLRRALSDKRLIRVIGISILVFAALYVLLVSFVPIPDGNSTIAVTVVGSLLAVAVPIILRYFTKQKDDGPTYTGQA